MGPCVGPQSVSPPPPPRAPTPFEPSARSVLTAGACALGARGGTGALGGGRCVAPSEEGPSAARLGGALRPPCGCQWQVWSGDLMARNYGPGARAQQVPTVARRALGHSRTVKVPGGGAERSHPARARRVCRSAWEPTHKPVRLKRSNSI